MKQLHRKYKYKSTINAINSLIFQYKLTYE